MSTGLHVDRDRFLLLFAAMAACHQGPSSTEGPPPGPSVAAATSTGPRTSAAPPPSAAAPAAPSAAPSVDLCAATAEHNRAVLTAPSVDCAAEPDADVPSVRRALANESTKLFAYCHKGLGTWAVRAVSASLSAPSGESGVHCGYSVTYQFVFDGTGGEVVSPTRTWGAFSDEHDETRVRKTFDFDGDGRDELIVEGDAWQNGAGTSASIEVLQASKGKVARYPVGFHIDQMTDADGDGRPDFVNVAFFATAQPCTLGGGMGLYGAPLLVHSLADGTFTMSDAVARRWARRECPTSSAGPGAATETAMSCARVWGRSASEITKAIPKANACGFDEEMARAFLRRPPPFKPLDAETPDPLPGAPYVRTEAVYGDYGNYKD